MAPVPTWAVAISKIVSGAIQGCLAAALVIPAVWIATGRAINPDWSHPLTLISIVILGALAGASLGLLMGTIVSPRSINLLFALLILPLTLLGCVTTRGRLSTRFAGSKSPSSSIQSST
jgi:ABC-2 type transport system permease protein